MAGYEYGRALKESWDLMKENFRLVYPLLFLTILSPILVIGTSFAYTNGLFGEPSLPSTIIKLVLASGSLGILYLIIVSFIMAGVSGMVNKIFKGNGESFWISGTRHWTKLIGLAVIQMLVLFIPLLLGSLIVWLLFLISDSFGLIALVILGALAVLYFFIVGILLSISMVFMLPNVIIHKMGSWKLFKFIIKHARKKFKHHILTWLIIFGVSIILPLIISIFLVPLNFIPIGGVEIASEIIYLIGISILQVYLLIFTFFVYYRK